MSPRKPSSVFLIVEHPNSQVQQADMPPTGWQAWRLPLEGDDDVKSVAERFYARQPIGSRVWIVEDTKVEAFDVGLTLTPVDDPRLGQDEEEEE